MSFPSSTHAFPATSAPRQRWVWLTIGLLALRPWIAVEITPGSYHAWLLLLSGCTVWRVVADRPQALRLLRSPLALLAGAAALWSALSWRWSVDPSATMAAVISGYEGCVILAAVALLPAVHRAPLLDALVCSALAISLLGLHQFFNSQRRYRIEG